MKDPVYTISEHCHIVIPRVDTVVRSGNYEFTRVNEQNYYDPDGVIYDGLMVAIREWYSDE